jgi:hypothetical protein
MKHVKVRDMDRTKIDALVDHFEDALRGAVVHQLHANVGSFEPGVAMIGAMLNLLSELIAKSTDDPALMASRAAAGLVAGVDTWMARLGLKGN